MRSVRLMLLPLLLCTPWLGCADDPEPKPDAGTSADSGTPEGDGGTDGGVSGDPVHVRRFARYLTASGFEERPVDLSQSPVELFLLQGDTFVSVAGTPAGPGEYVFPDVPRVTYYLKLGNDYLVTDSRDVDLSDNRMGRPEVVRLQNGLSMDMQVTGLEPWFQGPFPRSRPNPASELQFMSEQVGVFGSLSAVAETGATAVSDSHVGLTSSTGPVPRFEKEKGDAAWVIQLNPRSLGALPDGGTQNYLTAVGALQLPPFSSSESQPVRVEGALQPLAMTPLELDWKVSAFAAAASEVHPAATFRRSTFYMDPAPHGVTAGVVGFTSSLLRLERPMWEAADAVGTLVYGNPFPATWDLRAMAVSTFIVSLPVPDSTPFTVITNIDVYAPASTLSGTPILPRIRPPRGLTLDGATAYDPRTVSADSHVLAWQEPSTGAPADAYVVRVVRLGAPDDERITVYLSGRTPSVRLPPGILQPGQRYYFDVRAVLAEGIDVSSHPFMLDNPLRSSIASAVSGVVTVQAQTP
jgi:hypothetical protein